MPDTTTLKQWLTGGTHIAGTQIKLSIELQGRVALLISGLNKGSLESQTPLRSCAAIHAVIVAGSDNNFEAVPTSEVDLSKYERLARLKLNEYECRVWAELEPAQLDILTSQRKEVAQI